MSVIKLTSCGLLFSVTTRVVVVVRIELVDVGWLKEEVLISLLEFSLLFAVNLVMVVRTGETFWTVVTAVTRLAGEVTFFLGFFFWLVFEVDLAISQREVNRLERR